MTRPGAFLRQPASRTFRDRRDAGRVLAGHLSDYRNADGLLVLGLARGGVPVAWEVAAALHAPLDVFLVRKLGVPQQPELAMGALAGGQVVMNDQVITDLRISDEAVQAVIERETAELRRRERAYRGDRPAAVLHGQVVILVDDGIATGASVLAAVRAVQAAEPASIVVAVPVGPLSACRKIAQEADDVVCATMPAAFDAVGQAYLDFHQVSDDEVRDLLATPTTG
ncbi:phosphoribosyltransferase [Mycolicibacter longobardus]|uniref:Phosphoribosyl transferase n=1 Tax=Mycolicibacter longobardus TaxID=1108812 RepID=A0A1X1YN07_9MYCO|nr:phosphoribosyltransferase [Mycolicibacter longobardus]MCV7385171.1 phosphoribosyltransferase [Mycolicibacter longobardus]ORW12415.1 phosphoribosyl transferase [Mycolicibacter longobardus]